MSVSSVRVPAYADIEEAATRLDGVASRTPVVTSRSLDDRTGARVLLKCENLQRAGAFKFRGAYNAIARLTGDERRRGVVAFSSGNHAQAVALASRILGAPAVLVMPGDAPAVKRAATEGYGALIVAYDRERDDREAIGRQLAEERGLTLIPPFDHPDVIAGAGTCARELFLEAGPLDLLLVPCGGGGLLSGSALAARELSPSCRVIGVEPAGADDAARSFRSRRLQRVERPATIADGARTPSLGQLTFRLILDHVDDVVTVEDGPLLRWMFHLWERLKLIVEPTGALGAAALLEGIVQAPGLRTGIILTGGNVDLDQVGGWRRTA